MTKLELADVCDIDVRSISAYENGEYAPGNDRLISLSRVLRFPESFFSGKPLNEPRPDTASFRAQSKMSATQRDMALSQGAIALHLNNWLEERFELPKACIPESNREQTPDGAAEALRREWGLGNAPIQNMVHLLESKGVRVFSLSVKALEVDAFSMWQSDTPFVFLNTQKTAEHSRFDAAHELGHLVLDKHAACQGRLSERRADAFASAFLMPRASVLAHVPNFPSVENLISLKKVWGVSVAALAYRYHSLKVLSDWQYRSIYITLAKHGFSKSEPEPARHEVSQLLTKAFSILGAEGVQRRDIAQQLHIHVSELEDLLFGLGFGQIVGGRDKHQISTEHKKTDLILLK